MESEQPKTSGFFQSETAVQEDGKGGLVIDPSAMTVGVGYQTVWQMQSIVFMKRADGSLDCFLEDDRYGF